MSSTTSPWFSTAAGSSGTGPTGSAREADPAPVVSAPPTRARAIAVRAGQLLVWVLVTAPIALLLAGLALALAGAVFALVAG